MYASHTWRRLTQLTTRNEDVFVKSTRSNQLFQSEWFRAYRQGKLRGLLHAVSASDLKIDIVLLTRLWLQQMIRRAESNFEDNDTSETQGLLVFTAQSNVTGIKQDIGLLQKAQQMGFDTVIDVAALASTSRVSLNNINADAAIVSFYKLFGRLWSLKVLSLTGSSCS